MSIARLFLCFHFAVFRVPPYEGKLTIYGLQLRHIILIPLESFYVIPVLFLQLKEGVQPPQLCEPFFLPEHLPSFLRIPDSLVLFVIS